MNPRSQDTYTQAYNKWVQDQTPENMSELVDAFMPTVNSELQQYSGSKELMRTRAKSYVIKAIKSYDPMGKTALNSWVVTNLKQLSRYGKRLRPIRASEDMIRNAAELNSVSKNLEDQLGRKPTDQELQDETGWSIKTINRIRESSIPSVNSGIFDSADPESNTTDPMISHMDTTQFAIDSVYSSVNDIDRAIIDYKMGLHGKPKISGTEIASILGVSPAYVSQRSSEIGRMVSYIS